MPRREVMSSCSWLVLASDDWILGDGQREECSTKYFTYTSRLDVLVIELSINLYISTRTIYHVAQGGDMDRIRRNL